MVRLGLEAKVNCVSDYFQRNANPALGKLPESSSGAPARSFTGPRCRWEDSWAGPIEAGAWQG